jgi:hypothetical protein
MMRLTFTLETGNGGKADGGKLLEAMRAGYARLRDDERRGWWEGAAAVYKAATNEDAPAAPISTNVTPAPVDPFQANGLVSFKSGRSTPPPPRHPGAQRPVADESATE